MKNNKINVLDNGYIELIEAYGVGKEGVDSREGRNGIDEDCYINDYEVGIIEAARQSTQGNFRGWSVEEKLLKFLNDNKHTTPFEFAGMVIEVKLPIFVIREWHRHRTQSYNEMSARYSPLPDENYIPTLKRLFLTQEKNKQAQAVNNIELLAEDANEWLDWLDDAYNMSEQVYQKGLSIGIPKEIARIILPVGRYTKMRASANLLNWLKFIALRSTKSNPNAQYEIRCFADALETIIATTFPKTFAAFDNARGQNNE